MQETQKTPLSSVLNSKVVLFLLSQNLSLFGSSVVGFAIIWYITLETSSGMYLMAATIAQLVPHILISMYSGVWADRYNRKILIMLSDSFIALATLGLAIAFFLGFRSIYALLAVSVVRSIGGGIQSPAVNAMLPQLVKEEHLVRVQGINQTIASALMLLSPATGGLLLGLMDISYAFLLDVVTAALAVLAFSFISVKKQIRQTTGTPSMMREMKEGLHYTFSNRILRNLLICYAFSFFLITPAAILTPLMVQRSFGGEVWRLTANEMVWTVGSLLGGLYVSIKGNFSNKVRTIAFSLVGFGITFTMLGFSKVFPVYLSFMGIAGIFLPIFATAETVMIQEIADEDKLGRVFSIVQIISTSAVPLGILLFGPLSDRVSVESLLVVSGLLLTLVGFIYSRTASR